MILVKRVYRRMFPAIIFFIFILAVDVLARPVSFEGGWTVYQSYDADSAVLLTHYSPRADCSFGLRGEYMREKKWVFSGTQMNNLLKRWNLSDAQANLYLESAAGASYSNHGEFHKATDGAFFSGVSFDWENRRFYCAYMNRYMYAGHVDKFFEQRLRLGIAPYIGEYGDFHTWVMLEVRHKPEASDSIMITPFLRFFKGPFMFEVGANQNGDVMNTFSCYF